jgi:hypothetical protein
MGVALRLLYLIFNQLINGLTLLGRAPYRDIELLVLRHEVAVHRRTNPRPIGPVRRYVLSTDAVCLRRRGRRVVVAPLLPPLVTPVLKQACDDRASRNTLRRGHDGTRDSVLSIAWRSRRNPASR